MFSLFKSTLKHPSDLKSTFQVEELESREVPSTSILTTVSGQANIYSAGMSIPAQPPAPGGGGGGVYAQVIDLASLGNPTMIDFPSVSGEVSGWAKSGQSNGPDGGHNWGGVTNVPAWGGISGIRDNNATMFLSAVFLGAKGQPAHAPPSLDVSFANSSAHFHPLIGQQFFVGDGKTLAQTLQTFDVPADATRLYLGFSEGWGFRYGNLPGYYNDNSGSLNVEVEAVSAKPSLRITIPNDQTVFAIGSAPMPAAIMPKVVAEATFTGTNEAVSQVHWTAQIRFNGTETAHGVADAPLDLDLTTVDGHLVINPQDWPKVRGGSLTLIATTTINGQTVTATVRGLHIVGTNPTIGEVRAALGTDVLRRIANLESGFRQFGRDGNPLFSADNQGGAGIMQITPANEDRQWDWRVNVQAGIDKYNQSYQLSATYVNSLRGASQFAALVQAANQTRIHNGQSPVTISIPDFTADQRMKDAIRGYNGWAGLDPIDPTLHLHEFRLARDAKGQLKYTVIPGTNQATAIWERVPAADRPQKVGDPDYVNHVLAKSP